MTDRRAAVLRIAAGAGLLAACSPAVTRHVVGPREAAAFRRVNDLPDDVYGAAWPVMQVGALASPVAVAAALCLTGHRRTGVRIGAAGLAAWVGAKLVKRVYQRPRPVDLVTGTRVRGSDATGLGYVSGHAAVAAAMASAAFDGDSRALATSLLVAAPAVAAARMYVGAHLPLDAIGGVGVGLLVDGLLALGQSTGSQS
jgi:undecaprenyl-diphosphatase